MKINNPENRIMKSDIWAIQKSLNSAVTFADWGLDSLHAVMGWECGKMWETSSE